MKGSTGGEGSNNRVPACCTLLNLQRAGVRGHKGARGIQGINHLRQGVSARMDRPSSAPCNSKAGCTRSPAGGARQVQAGS
jgi:hypothetical protein